MESEQVIDRRRTVRDFSDKEIPFKIIEKALMAGLKAPSYNHLKQWDFILIKDLDIRLKLTKTEKMIEKVTKELEEAFEGCESLVKNMYLDAIPKQKRMILEAPELLVVTYKPKTQIRTAEKIYDLNCLALVWCCIENILLTLCEEDVYGVTFIPKNTEEITKVLSIPNEIEVAAIIPIGYKKENIRIFPQKHIELKEKLHINYW